MHGKTIVMLQSELPDFSSMDSDTKEEVTKGISTGDNIWQFIGLVVLLIIILVAAYYTSKFVGRIKFGQLKNSNFKVIDSYRISPNKVLQIVKIGNKYVVIAIGKDTINMITELDESEVFLRECNTIEKQNFKQIFDRFRNNNE